MLFLSNERKVETGQLFVDIQPMINGLLALSALALGIPYVIWMILKRRESLTGPEFLGSPRWTWLERVSGKGWFALSFILACSCSCLLTGILFWLAQPKK
jgi:hypothetical protein